MKIFRAGVDTLTYHSTTALSVGHIVKVPIGKQAYIGVIMAHAHKPTYDTKSITLTLYPTPLPHHLVTTARWMSQYYATPLATVLQTLLPRGLEKIRRPRQTVDTQPIRIRTHFLLNPHQVRAIQEIHAASPGTILLHGVTGSGKTAIYRELAREQIESGHSVILLVPEIALTSQLVDDFIHCFPNVYVTHSRQTEAERHRIWRQILLTRSPCVIIGPRSALFLPVASLGLIVIDECQEPSYQQEQSPRYLTQRVAGHVARNLRIKLVLGSATPSITDYYFAQHTHRPIVRIAERAVPDIQSPAITIVDMSKKQYFSKHSFLSTVLLEATSSTLAAGGQVLFFHNRRGSASTTLCEMCSWSAACPRCFVPYTLHADRHHLHCHICGISERIPTQCPDCHSVDIIHKGIGTKRIEAELRHLYPEKTIARFDGDVDAVSTVDARYSELYNGTIDIIIGTQVVAKGLDLPHLRLVAIVQADAGLSLPDFSASERVFQLTAQTVGRVGRNTAATQVIIQTYQPNHPAITAGIHQDYGSFYAAAIRERHRGLFPPFRYLLKLTCLYKTEAAAIRNAQLVAKNIIQHFAEQVTILGPTPAFYERQHNTYRWQIIIKSTTRATLLTIANNHVPTGHWQIELDPQSLL